MKYKSIGIIICLLMLSYAKIHTNEIKSIGDLLSEIKAEQKLKNNEVINPDKVGIKLLEELGVSVMKKTIWNQNVKEHPNENVSTSLSALNQGMGYSYLMGMTGIGGMMPGYDDDKPAIKESSINWNNDGLFGNGDGWLLGIVIFLSIPVLTGFIVFFSYRIQKKRLKKGINRNS